MLTKANNKWAGFTAKNGIAQLREQPKLEGKKVDDMASHVKEDTKLYEKLHKLISNTIPVAIEADKLENGIVNAPYDTKKQLIYLKYVQVYLEAQLAEVKQKQQELEEELLNER